MPFVNEHAARVRNPGDFKPESFRRKKIKTTKGGVFIIVGRLKGKVTTTTQAYRFSIQQWTAKEAREWLKENKIKVLLFEPATGKKDKTGAYASEETTPEGENMEETMDLKEFLASNPDAKTAHESALASAKAAGVEEGKAQVQARIDAVTPYLNNENYKGIGPLAKEVLAGTSEVSSLKGAIAAVDMMREQGASADARKETEEQGDANGEQQTVNTTGLIESEADILALVQGDK